MALLAFSLAFAFVEAAVVVYIRNLPGGGLGYEFNDYQTILNLRAIAFIVPKSGLIDISHLKIVEIIREFSTIIMLLSVAFLAGQNVKQKIGAFLLAFSLWDIFYYVFLRLMLGWPKTLTDLDVYFLIPIPWIGPVITPLVISTVLAFIGLKLFFGGSFLNTRIKVS